MEQAVVKEYRVLTLKEAAAKAHLSDQTIYNLIKANKIEAYEGAVDGNFGRPGWRIYEYSLIDYVNQKAEQKRQKECEKLEKLERQDEKKAAKAQMERMSNSEIREALVDAMSMIGEMKVALALMEETLKNALKK